MSRCSLRANAVKGTPILATWCDNNSPDLQLGEQVNLESVQRLKCAEGLLPIWDIASFHR